MALMLSRALSTPAGLSGAQRIVREVRKEDGHVGARRGSVQASSPGSHVFLELAAPEPTSPRNSLWVGAVCTRTPQPGGGGLRAGWLHPWVPFTDP